MKNFHKEIKKQDFLYRYLDDEYYLDHNVLGEFIYLDSIPKPQNFEEFERILIPFEYYSQVLQFSADCRELIHKEVGRFIAQVK